MKKILVTIFLTTTVYLACYGQVSFGYSLEGIYHHDYNGLRQSICGNYLFQKRIGRFKLVSKMELGFQTLINSNNKFKGIPYDVSVLSGLNSKKLSFLIGYRYENIKYPFDWVNGGDGAAYSCINKSNSCFLASEYYLYKLKKLKKINIATYSTQGIVVRNGVRRDAIPDYVNQKCTNRPILMISIGFGVYYNLL